MNELPENIKDNEDRESFLNELYAQFVQLSNKLGAYIHKFNNADLHASIDLEEVLSEFTKRDIHTVDRFCSDYIQKKMEKEGVELDIREHEKNFRALRQFLYEERRKGAIKYPFKG